MTLLTKYYKIHNILRFKITIEVNKLNRYFVNRFLFTYSSFETKNNKHNDIIINIGPFTPDLNNCYKLENPPKYFVKKGFFYCKDSYKMAKWEMEIRGLESRKTTVKINGNKLSLLFIQTNIIDPLIIFKLNLKGYIMLHSSCVSNGQKGFLFPARSGSGKTITALYFVLFKNFKLLGDNWIILNKRNILSCFYPLNIFSYNIRPLSKKIREKDKKILKLKNLFYNISKGYVKIFSSFKPKEIFPNNITDRAELDSVYFLENGKEFSFKKIGIKEMVHLLKTNNKMDAIPFYTYTINYSFIFPNSKVSKQWTLMKKNLRQILKGKSLYKAIVPSLYTDDVFEKIFNLVSK